MLCTPRESVFAELTSKTRASSEGNSTRSRSTASLRERELLEQLQRRTRQRSADDRTAAEIFHTTEAGRLSQHTRLVRRFLCVTVIAVVHVLCAGVEYSIIDGITLRAVRE